MEAEDVAMSDSSSESDNEMNEQTILELKKRVEANKFDYDAHVTLINHLRKLSELELLRKARQSMNEVYPLSPELWLAWLSDEQKICCTEEERVFVIELFQKAVKEYMSVQIWVEYIMFMLGGGKMEETRRVCEEALTAVGIHLAEGILVWQAVILVEQQYLLSLASDDEAIEEQKKKVQNLYRRQARVPLMNCDREEFLTEASKWFEDEILPQVKRDLENSHKKMLEKVSFENSLLNASDDTEKLEAYRKYIDFVRKSDNPAVIQNLYERTVTELCLNAGMWEEYVRFAMDQFSGADYVILPLCERSQLNCPWSSALFGLRINALQNFAPILGDDKVRDGIEGALKKTLECGSTNETESVNIWMDYLVYLRRQITIDEVNAGNASLEIFRQGFERSISYMDERFGENGDPECRLARFRCHFEAACVKNMDIVRSLWNDLIMKRNNNFKSAKLWLEFIHLERHFGDEKHCRKLYRRALERVWDDVEHIGASFLLFEQVLGSLESHSDFERRYRDRLCIVHKRRMEENTKEEIRKEQFKKEKAKSTFKTETVKPKFAKLDPKFKKDVQPENNNRALLKRGSSEANLSPPPGYKKPRFPEKTNQTDEQRKAHGEFVTHDSSLDYRSVFLSNMDFNAPEEHVLAVFKDCGTVENFRIAKDFKGRSKGFAYLVFEDAASVAKALAKDRTPVGIRPLFVSKCNPRNREPSFKYSSKLEPEKLFIKGLPLGMSEKDIRETFESQGGNIKSVRLVTNRNGYSKGNCYIEYQDAATATAIREKMDGSVIKDHTISVQISNPSAPKTTKQLSESRNIPLPKKSTVSESRKPKLSFLPRALQKKIDVNTKQSNPPSTSNAGATASNGSQNFTSKSNEDFRKMLLK